MTPRQTLKRIELSIRHWERICKKSKRDEPSPEQCALCVSFSAGGCLCCPVAKMVGHTRCYETPYRYAAIELDRARKTTAARRKELAFLRKVRTWWMKKHNIVVAKKG